MEKQKAVPAQDAEKILKTFEEWAEGKKARECVPPVGVRSTTHFMRSYRVFNELFRYFSERSDDISSVSGMVVGAGLSSHFFLADEPSGRPYLDRPMSFEYLELASCFERLNRLKNAKRGDFDWRLTVVEKDPRIADWVRRQRVVTLLPRYGFEIPPADAVRGYIEGFLPGARRRFIPKEEMSREMGSIIEVMGMKGVTVAHVPSHYRERMDVIACDIQNYNSELGSQDVALCIMSGNYIKNKKSVVEKLLCSLRPGGVLVTDILPPSTNIPSGYSLEERDINSKDQIWEKMPLKWITRRI